MTIATSTIDASNSDLDPYSPRAQADPHAFYDRLRQQGPVVYVPGRDVWLVSGYAQAVAVLRNHADFVSGDGVTFNVPSTRTERYPLIENDPPLHDRIRRSVQPSFTKRAIESFAPGVENAASEIAHDAVELGEFDAVEVIARAMPDQAMTLLTGITPPSAEALAEWSDATSRGEEPAGTQQHSESVMEALTWLATEGLPAMPAHCLGRLIVDSGGHDGRLDEDGSQRLMTLASMWLAGIDSTGALLGNAIDAFVDHPDQWDLLRSRPDLIPNAAEELLRFGAPFKAFFRRTRTTAHVDGAEIPAGARVAVMLAAASRDPLQFPDPHRLDITRENAKSHLAFGNGLHVCLGSPFARLEVVSLLAELARRVARFERAGEARRSPSQTVHKFDTLPVRVVPAEGESK
ncbi:MULTISPECIES: cytochrome P450 [Nocardiaceae]|uniref:Cytochrome P450 n=1 Tax=Rhodococcoides kroppenstedtii TaxID=293050 RepID=A0ABS7NTT6_9NOCA|nr:MULTISPECIES: cytochrome P450 [Rhodococcus]AMY20346.1 Cytochrome P450 monooxygenase PikC [Rhodococcus sp. PBTS 1]MBY6313916.1 cytochrome P450 [Rhodococcus kroppenstedtii]MBY6321420.1 cytochrome P450 [Rhodococcus kroppenstedtii]MBY6400118.1 cytochrome P450 [Rhodococcus kroppenstedtii]